MTSNINSHKFEYEQRINQYVLDLKNEGHSDLEIKEYLDEMARTSKLEQRVKTKTFLKGKGAMILGGILMSVGSSIPLIAGIDYIFSALNHSVYNPSNMKSAIVTGGIIFGAGLALELYGTANYWNESNKK
jgi:hypothetical protein